MICYIAKQNKTKANFEKRSGIPATKSGHLQLLITCNSCQHFAGTSELLSKVRSPRMYGIVINKCVKLVVEEIRAELAEVKTRVKSENLCE